MIRYPAIVLVALACATPALGADANAGKNTFRRQCALCHSAEPGDNGGAQGPNLNGVFGRPAATDPRFGYTQALKGSKLTWDAATLNRFLAAPTTVVPGSAMVVAVPDDNDRANLIAYFQGVKEGTFQASGPPPQFSPPPSTNAGPPKGEADWKKDVPGRVHRVNVSTLPAPFDSPSASNFPKLVERPASADRPDRYPWHNHLIGLALANADYTEALNQINAGESHDCSHNEGRRRNDWELRRGQVLLKKDAGAAVDVFNRLVARTPDDLDLRGKVVETLLSAKQAAAKTIAEESLALARKQNNRDREGYFAELADAAKRL